MSDKPKPPRNEERISHVNPEDEAETRYSRQDWLIEISTGAIADLRRLQAESDEIMNFPATCGLCAAVASAPELVRPSKWLDIVKGDHPFTDPADVARFTDGLTAVYNAVQRSIAEQGAHCVPTADAIDDLAAFCTGYLAIATADATWEADQASFIELVPLLAISQTTPMSRIADMVPDAKDDPEGWLQEQRQQLPATITDFYEYWADTREIAAKRIVAQGRMVRNDAPKVGRNSPCPCGSGKKFKRCCLN